MSLRTFLDRPDVVNAANAAATTGIEDRDGCNAKGYSSLACSKVLAALRRKADEEDN